MAVREIFCGDDVRQGGGWIDIRGTGCTVNIVTCNSTKLTGVLKIVAFHLEEVLLLCTLSLLLALC